MVLGPNGAGKTVLMRMQAGLERPDYGGIAWNGAGTPGDRIAMAFPQKPSDRDRTMQTANFRQNLIQR